MLLPPNATILRCIQNTENSSLPPPRIASVVRDDGTRSTDADATVTRFTAFFESLFMTEVSTPTGDAPVSTLVSDLPQAPEERGSPLCCPVTTDEWGAVVCGMKSGSAPGPDGLPIYKTFWPVLNPVLVSLVNEFLQSGQVPSSFKRGRVALLPKGSGSDPGHPISYRPNTLLNVDSKILTSLHAGQLRDILPYVVSPFRRVLSGCVTSFLHCY